MVQDGTKFSHTMSLIETYIKNLDAESVFNSLISLCNSSDLTEKVREKINELSNTFVDLERRQWNGIWARIIANFLATANMGKFDLIVGTPHGLIGRVYLLDIEKGLNHYVSPKIFFLEMR